MAASMTASLMAPTAVVAKAAPSKASLARLSAPAAPTFAMKTRSNGVATRAMLVWTPINNKCVLHASVATAQRCGSDPGRR